MTRAQLTPFHFILLACLLAAAASPVQARIAPPPVWLAPDTPVMDPGGDPCRGTPLSATDASPPIVAVGPIDTAIGLLELAWTAVLGSDEPPPPEGEPEPIGGGQGGGPGGPGGVPGNVGSGGDPLAEPRGVSILCVDA